MCSRFELNSPAREITARFRLPVPPPNLPGPVIRPTDPALVVTVHGPRVLRFGFAVDWAKRLLIIARAETVRQRSSFKPLLSSRCLVPASAWFEWQEIGPGKKKPLWRLRPAGQIPFALAGLVSGESFVLLTCAAAPSIAVIHDRMPVVATPAWEKDWLDGGKDFAELEPALVSYDGIIEAACESGQIPAS
jgi:putative SOS response-associated peptidase YedK